MKSLWLTCVFVASGGLRQGKLGGFMRKAIHRSFLPVAVAAAFALFGGNPAQSQTAPFIAKAEQAYMIDAETGTVLLSQNENQSFPPASLAKLMTVEVVLDALSKGQVTPETPYPVS